MAKFLTTNGNTYQIEQIITSAKEYLVLVTPYLQLDNNFYTRLQEANQKGISITLIYGKNELAHKEYDKLMTMLNLKIYYHKDLHAKCYHNENQMVITSMNLYEYSMRNNREMGIYIEKENDKTLFDDTIQEINFIKNTAHLEKDSIKTPKKDDFVRDNYEKHLPFLYDLLKLKLPKHSIEWKERSLIIHDFPKQEMYVEISSRIDFRFPQSTYFRKVEYQFAHILQQQFPLYRFFWNHFVINAYVDVTGDTIQKSNAFLELILGVEKLLNK